MSRAYHPARGPTRDFLAPQHGGPTRLGCYDRRRMPLRLWPRLGRRLVRPVAVLLASLSVWSSLQFATPALIGEDGHYHLRMAQLVRERGPLHEFPWMAFTVLARRFSDKDFLFHRLRSLVPARDEVWTSKAFAAVCASLVFLALYLVLAAHRVPGPEAWLLLAFGSGVFWLMRLLYFRPHLLQILGFVLALGLIVSRRHLALFVLSALYALAHVSAFVVIGLAALWTLVRYAYERAWRAGALVAATAGVAAGYAIHPNFPVNLYVWYVQIVQTLRHAFHVGGASDLNQGVEFWPVDGQLLLGGAPLPVLLLLVMVAALLAERSRVRPDTAFLALVAVASFGAFLLARRFMELWAPAQVLATAFVVRDGLRRWVTQPWWTARRGLARALGGAALAVVIFHDVGLYARMRVEAINQSRSPYETDYREVGRWLDRHLPPGELVYNATWGAFAYLFDHAPRQRYVVGLDPVFLHAYSPDLSTLYGAIARGEVADSPAAIERGFGARWVLVEWQLVALEAQLQEHPRAVLRFHGDATSVYEIVAAQSFEHRKRLAEQAVARADWAAAAAAYDAMRRDDPERSAREGAGAMVDQVERQRRAEAPRHLLWGRDEGFQGWLLEEGVHDPDVGFTPQRAVAEPDTIRREVALYRSSPDVAGRRQLRLTSPRFRITSRRIAFAVTGGSDVAHLRLSLWVDGREVLWTTGSGSAHASSRLWDVAPWRGREATLVLADYRSNPGAFLWVDDLRMLDG